MKALILFGVALVLVFIGLFVFFWLQSAPSPISGLPSHDWIQLHGALEALYFVSGPMLVLAAILALGQIRQARTLAAEATAREEHKLAIQQCLLYDPTIDDRLYEATNAKGLHDLRNIPWDFETGEPKIPIQQYTELLGKSQAVENELLAVLNHLDSVALPFIMGMADEEVGFLAIGKSFISSVERYGPIAGPWYDWGSPMWSLYRRWKKMSESNDHQQTLKKNAFMLNIRAKQMAEKNSTP